MKRPWLTSAIVIGSLISVGVGLVFLTDRGGPSYELGLAVVSGGLVGAAILVSQSLLSDAATRQSERNALLLRLTMATDLSVIDLHGADLAGLYLPDRRLLAANLTRTNLSDALLFHSDLRHADLRGARLERADLRGATLVGARLDQADLSNADLEDANLQRVSFAEALLDGCKLVTVDLRGADLSRAHLEGVVFGPIMYDRETKWPDGYPIPPNESLTWAVFDDGPDFPRWLSQALRKRDPEATI